MKNIIWIIAIFAMSITITSCTQSSQVKSSQVKILPYDQKLKVESCFDQINRHYFGEILTSTWFSGSIYNRSEWTVTRMLINIKAFEKNGSKRWDRDFYADVKAAPLETGRFSVEIIDYNDDLKIDWSIKEIYGHIK